MEYARITKPPAHNLNSPSELYLPQVAFDSNQLSILGKHYPDTRATFSRMHAHALSEERGAHAYTGRPTSTATGGELTHTLRCSLLAASPGRCPTCCR
eukprot:957948-Pelagomonas_calceolata.AAC.5